MKTASETTWTMRIAVEPELSEKLIEDLVPGTVYNFRIIAKNVHGESVHADSNILVYQAS
jgi:hypothetical protein